jgi:hypothetical protein
MRNAKLITLAVGLLLAVVVVLQNTEDATVRILFTTVIMSRAVLLGATLLVGFALGLLAGARFLGKGGGTASRSGYAGDRP